MSENKPHPVSTPQPNNNPPKDYQRGLAQPLKTVKQLIPKPDNTQNSNSNQSTKETTPKKDA